MPFRVSGRFVKCAAAHRLTLEADDGRWYVVRFRHRPQHRRIPVNELMSFVLLSYLKVTVPERSFA